MKENKKNKITNKICKIKKSNPSWGYRKVWGCLKKDSNIKCSLKSVYQIMKEESLLRPQVKSFDFCLPVTKDIKIFVTISKNFKR